MKNIAEGTKIEIPPHGYVRYVDSLGTDQRIVEAARISYGSPSKGEEADKKLLMYLFRNRHTSPFEQCNITFNIKFPIFLMRQFVRHRTFRLNEMSARYTEMPEQFYLPDKWRRQGGKDTQGSIPEEDWSVRDVSGFSHNGWNSHLAEQVYDYAYRHYQILLERGVAKEQARMVLPVGLYTEIYVNIDLHNLMHFLRLRLDSHAQREMQEIAQAMHQIARQLYPWTSEAFDRFQMQVVDAYAGPDNII